MDVSPRSALVAAALTLLVMACGPTSTGTGVDGGPNETCDPGDTGHCYDGPGGTEGVGPCTGGTRTCDANGHWGTCMGEIIPGNETCSNDTDDNCNGQVDEETDEDGDGYTNCAGDCCDTGSDGCAEPNLVSPGSFEVVGNALDDNCNGQVDEETVTNCDAGLQSNSASALDFAKAIDLCQMAANGSWGVVDATFVRADGTGAPNANQHAIRTTFGGVQVQGGMSYAVLSTGNAAATGQTSPPFVDFQNAGPRGSSSGVPADWRQLNNNNLPNAPGCPEPADGAVANDPIMLQLRIKTPSNARSFSLSTNFLSSEYPEWVCSPFNDFFVVLLDSTWNGAPANPHDKNLAIYTSPTNQTYPVGVNLGHGNTGLFRQCVNGATGCGEGSTAGTINTCTGIDELEGTGLERTNPGPNPLYPLELGYCGANNRAGGGTGWLVTSGNVNGGETITLRIALWDVSDEIYDSAAIIDNFQWSVDASDPGTVIP
jgi:hypothetical protein